MTQRRVTCSAVIADSDERELVLQWVQLVANKGYSVVGNKVTMTYEEQQDDHDSSYWAIVHFFEGYKDHEIESVDVTRS